MICSDPNSNSQRQICSRSYRARTQISDHIVPGTYQDTKQEVKDTLPAVAVKNLQRKKHLTMESYAIIISLENKQINITWAPNWLQGKARMVNPPASDLYFSYSSSSWV
jgi:hypothetical protein